MIDTDENFSEKDAIKDGLDLYTILLSLKVDEDDKSDWAIAIKELQNAHRKST